MGVCCMWLLNAEIWEGGVMQHIGVEEGKCFGVGKILAGILPNLPKKILGQFLWEHFLKQTFFLDDLQKKVFMRFCKRWAPFFQIKHRWAPFLSRFSGILQRFSQILRRFTQIFPDFQHMETFGGALAPLLLHHWCSNAVTADSG